LNVTASLSSVGSPIDGTSDAVQYHFGAQVAYGITEKIDIRSRYERVWLSTNELSTERAFDPTQVYFLLSHRFQ
jgi:hypothetical protein